MGSRRTTSVLLSWIEAEPCYGTMDLVFPEFHDSETSGQNISFSTFINSHYNDTVRGLARHHITEKSISLLGVITGFVLLLLLMAFITCIRQRKIYQGYVEARDPRRLYRVYCQLEEVYVYTINEAERDISPPDYDSI